MFFFACVERSIMVTIAKNQIPSHLAENTLNQLLDAESNLFYSRHSVSILERC
jgi:hypothetical protein